MSVTDWWVVLVAVAVAAGAAACYGWRRRELVLDPPHLEFSMVDSLKGRQFARFCAALLRLLGYRRLRLARAPAGITADAPDGTAVAVRCITQKDQVAVAAVRELHEAITSGARAGRRGVLITNAQLTPEAWEFAGGSAITVADRAVLRHWMEEARRKLGERPAGSGRRAGTRVLAGAACCAALAACAVVVHAAVSGARPGAGRPRSSFSAAPAALSSPSSAPGSPSSAPGTGASPGVGASTPASRAPHPDPPGTVVREFYAAISRHDWQQVWQLGGRNLGYGHYSSYQGMVSGYARTARDVVTVLHVNGDAVTGQFRAYQADGGIRDYRFGYTVRGGAIVSGRQDLMSVRET